MKLDNNNFEEILSSIRNKNRISYKNIRLEISNIDNKLHYKVLPSIIVLAIIFIATLVLIGILLIVFQKEGFDIFGRILALILLLSIYPISTKITKKFYSENINEFNKMIDKYEELKFLRQR